MTYLILHGATAQPQTLAQAAAFDTLTGLKQNVVQMFWSMQQGRTAAGQPNFTPFSLATADALWKRGQLYLHTWGTWDWVNKIAWLPADVIAGKYDAYLHAQAQTIATWKHPLFVRLDHEFNLPSTPWYTTPADFVALWRYIVALFRGDGATNVTWVWCPNHLSPSSAAQLAAFYPGDDYVDWTAFDVYNTAASKASPWLNLSPLVSGSPATATWIADTYATIARIAPMKPMMLAEFGCHNVGGDKAAWIADALAVIPRTYPLIRAINYYQVVDGPSNWPLGQGAGDGSAAAYTAAIKAGPYPLTFTMPPDLRPIQPLQSATLWGDQLGELNAQLVAATSGNTTLQTTLLGLHRDLTDAAGQRSLDAETILDLQRSATLAAQSAADATTYLERVRANIRGLIDAAAEAV